jgi:zinc/manganese transport system substrate-binding protein
VVAAENVYGDIAAQIGGARVTVTSILANPAADPHLFEPGTAAGFAVALADVMIENGLGYDAFADKLLAAAPRPGRVVVNVAEVLRRLGPGTNPHLWYDVPQLPRIASAIAEAMTKADPAGRRTFAAGRRRFVASLGPLDRAVAGLKAGFGGTPVAYTEPVPGYLLEAAGLPVLTPPGFARAIEEGTDPDPAAVAEMRSLFTERRVRLLLYNTQATSPVTQDLRELATQNGIPVVGVTELLPLGLTYQEWQLRQVNAMSVALGRGA